MEAFWELFWGVLDGLNAPKDIVCTYPYADYWELVYCAL